MSDFFTSIIPLSLDSIIHGIGDGIVVCDRDYRFVAANENYASFYGVSGQELIGKTAFDLNPDFSKTVFHDALSNTIKNKVASTAIGYASNSQKWLVVRSYLYQPTVDLPDAHYVMIVHSLNNGKEKNAYVSHFDTLTSLPNRVMYEEDMQKLGSFASQSTFVLFDLKRFRMVNDTVGVANADLCLMESAARLRLALNGNDSLYRISVDQFLMVLSSSTSLEEKIKAINQAFDKPFLVDSKSIRLGYYLAVYRPESPEKAHHALRCAELALNHAKKKKLNLVFFSPEMEKPPETLEIEQAIKEALDNDQFEMFYQPQGDMASNKVCGAEALIRWRHPSIGFIPPDKFLPIAQNIGLMEQIDRWVFDRVLKDSLMFQNLGITIPISINLSGEGIANEELQNHILQQLAIHPYPLCFEITETGFMDLEKSKDFIKKLREENFSIAIDDFGTGYCSLEYLLHYPSDYLKIEKKFVRDLHKIIKNQTIVSNIIKLGQSLGIYMVAEGVETMEELQTLKGFNCDVVQGYFFAKPTCVEDFIKFCTNKGCSALKSGCADCKIADPNSCQYRS